MNINIRPATVEDVDAPPHKEKVLKLLLNNLRFKHNEH